MKSLKSICMSEKVLLLAALFIIFIPQIPAAEVSGKDLVKSLKMEAENALPAYLDAIPRNEEINYGFNSRSEFLQAQIGEPYQVYTISTQNIKNHNKDGKELLKTTGEYRYPVIVNGEYRALLTLAKTKDGWKAVDFGAARLAEELENHEVESIGSRARKTDGQASKSIKILLRLYEKNCDFISIGQQNEEHDHIEFIPLESADLALYRKSTQSVLNNKTIQRTDLKNSYNLKELINLIETGKI